MFWPKHKHFWVEQSREYTPPSSKLPSIKGGNSDLILKLQYGLTNIEMRCGGCGDMKVITTPGKVEL